jgi:predicted transcriptional regulator
MRTLPQEIEVWYIIPAIRRELAKSLIETHKITYEKAGQILGISKAAISQYLKNKRASRIKLHDNINKEVEKSSIRLLKGKSDAVMEITKLLELIRKKQWYGSVCKKMINNELQECKEVRT